MARQIVVERGGKVSSFAFAKVDRHKLYGSRKRIPLDPSGNTCARASLTEDGSTLLQAGMTAQGYFTDEGEWISNRDLVGLDEEGKAVDKVASTLGEPQALEGPVSAEALLDASVIAVYALDESEVEAELIELLRSGDVFKFPFNYRPDYKADEAFLVANKEGELFAIVTRPTHPDWRDAEETIPTFEESDDDDDDGDLDFEMF